MNEKEVPVVDAFRAVEILLEQMKG